MKYLFYSLIACLTLSSCNWLSTSTKKISLKNLKHPVLVTYDRYGVPHIEAKNKTDLMKALGYITASERLFQMDLLRRIGSGRLSEIFGDKLLETDILLRRLSIRHQMRANWLKFKDQAPKKMIDEIEAYLEGANAFIKNGPSPIEEKLLNYKIEPFNYIDTLTIAGYMALSFAESLDVDVMYTDLLNRLPKNEVDLIFPRGSLDLTHSNITSSKKYDEDVASHYFNFIDTSLKRLNETHPLFQGSNSWALSGKRTESGKPILANDPHIGYSSPSVWFEAHIKSPEYEDYGHYIPLIPFPGLAHNNERGWAITMAKIDEMDLYKETFHPTDKNKVLYKNKYVDVKKRKEIIKIKGEEPHTETVVVTPHGPMINGTKYAPEDLPLSLKWQFLNPNNNPGYTFYLLSLSKDLDDLAPALSHSTSPSFNITFADSKGNIGWHIMGRIPKRPKGVNGKTILNGSNGKNDYDTYYDIMENPHDYNPETGVVANANQKPSNTEGEVQGMWLSKDRHLRILKLLSQKKKWNLEELKKIQTDSVYPSYSVIKKALSYVNLKEDTAKEAMKLMKEWNGEIKLESPEASILYTFLVFILKNTLKDDLGEENFKVYSKRGDPFNFLRTIFKNPDSVLWDNKKTPDIIESQKDIVQESFLNSVDHLRDKFGFSVRSWMWSRLHSVEFEHPMGKVFPLNILFNVGPYPAPGGGNVINNFGGDKADLDFDVVYGPSTRRLIDFAQPEHSYGILPTGNSGRRFSKHYKDQTEMFLNNEYRAQTMNIIEIKQPSHKKLLTPEETN